jgi:carboxymethylenebutenolidase
MTSAVERSAVTGDTVQFVSDGQTIRGYLARSLPGPRPGLIVLHEWWGLNEQTINTTRRFAQAGYTALAVDQYSRQGYTVTKDPNEASQLMNGMSSQRVLRDINAAIRYLKATGVADPLRIGMVGYSLGAMMALTMANHNSDLKAVVAYCGKTPPVENIESFLCPVQFHHAAKDGWVTGKEVDALKQGLEKEGKPSEVLIYPQADHAFYNDARPDVYRRDDAEKAWASTLDFLARSMR